MSYSLQMYENTARGRVLWGTKMLLQKQRTFFVTIKILP